MNEILANIQQINLDQFSLSNRVVTDFSVDFDATSKETGQIFTLSIFQISEHVQASLLEKLLLYTKLQSPFFLEFIGLSLRRKKLYILTEKPKNGTLNQVFELEKTGKVIPGWDNTKKLINIYGIAMGMSYIHSQNIILQTLKSSQIYLDEHLFPKIKFISETYNFDDRDKSVARVCQERENYLYLPPELITDFKQSNKIDVYAFSIVLYKIFVKEIDFPIDKVFQILNKISEGERPKFPKSIPKCYKDLIEKCWAQEPEKRPTFDQIISTIKNNKEFITEIGANEEEFNEYLKYIEGEKLFTNFPKFHICFDKYEKKDKKNFSVKMQQADLSEFDKNEKIGKGAFGVVFKVTNKETRNIFAAKISIKYIDECNDDEINSLTREIKIISQLSSPTVVKFIGYSPNDFDDEVRPTIITEILPNGSLGGLLNNANKGLVDDNWDETKKLINIYGIAYSMSYLHSLDIIHRDLKPENIFLDDYLYPKLGDFGLSKSLTEKLINEPSTPQFYLKGTYAYMAPEILSSFTYSKSSDVYAYSMVIYQILSNEIPFDGFDQYKFYTAILSGYRPEFNFPILDCYKKLIEKCWSNDPNERPTFDDIVHILKTNEEIITDQVDKNEFYNYIEMIGDKIIQKTNRKKSTKKSKKVKKILLKSYKNCKIDNETYMSTLQDKYMDLSNYEKAKLVQKSDLYKTYQVKNKETGKIYAGKFLSVEIDSLTPDEIINLSREVNIISGIKHPSLLKFIGYSPYNYKNKPKPIFLTELPSNMTLSKILQLEREGHHIQLFDDTIKLINIYGIAAGMDFLHSHQIIHRDLNPESIFLDEHLFPKIGNFSFLVKKHMMKTIMHQSTAQIKGNPNYSAPEILTNNDYSQASDVYSFAMIVYEIMTNEIPFKNTSNLYQLINDVGINGKRPSFNKSIPCCYSDLIKSCWNQNPEKRPSFEEISLRLKNDERFITDKVNKENYTIYVKNIESICKEFYRNRKITEKECKIVECDDEQMNSQKSENKNQEDNNIKERFCVNQPEIEENKDIQNDKSISKCCLLI